MTTADMASITQTMVGTAGEEDVAVPTRLLATFLPATTPRVPNPVGYTFAAMLFGVYPFTGTAPEENVFAANAFAE